MISSLNATEPSPSEAVENHRKIINSHWSDLLKLLSDSSLLDILREKQKQDRLPDSLGFNLFRLISGTYYRENFHSDIIRSLLDPTESHGAGHRHVHAFIEWLKKCRPDLVALNPQDFQNVEVTREQHGRIDIVIKSSNKAIIVENKIYGARDMERQLPRYLDKLEDGKFEVVAIVYLTLNQSKDPVKTNWLPAVGAKASDLDRVQALLIPVVAFSHDPRSLLDWIQECERNTTEFDTLAALRQYRQLIQHLGAHAMSDSLMEKLYEKITDPKDPSFLPNARSLVNIMDDLPQYRASRIKKRFEANCRPFLGVSSKSGRVTFSGQGVGEYDYLMLDVHCTEDVSILSIWDWDYLEFDMSRVDNVITEKSLDKKLFRCLMHEPLPHISQCWIQIYKFPKDESNLIDDLKHVFLKLEEWKSERGSNPSAESVPRELI